MEEFISRGGIVGKGERIEAGGWLKGEKRFKVVKKKRDLTKASGQQGSDGWIGGSSQSVYAAPLSNGGATCQDAWIGGSSQSVYASQPREETEEQDSDGWIGGLSTPKQQSKAKVLIDKSGGDQRVDLNQQDLMTVPPRRQLRKSRSGLSLSERLGMDGIKEASNAEPMPAVGQADKERQSGSAIDQAAAIKVRPPNLDLQERQEELLHTSLRTPIAQAPLSATHAPPQTPLKHFWRGSDKQADLPPTPGSEAAVHTATSNGGPNRAGGLLLDPGEGTHVLPKELQTPIQDSFPSTALEAAALSPGSGKSQIDQMLAKLRLARSSGGTQESRWAVKQTEPSERDAIAEIQKEEKKKVLPASVPTAPRALREGQQGDKATPTPPPPPKSLFERLAPAAIEVEALQKASKGKKERKRGSRKGEIRPEESGSATPVPAAADIARSASNEGDRTPVLRDHSSKTPAANKDQADEESRKGSAETDVAPSSSSITTSTSNASLATESSKEGSHVGNDTLASINWADDDDDDTLPELPEEWTRTSQLANASNSLATPAPDKTAKKKAAEEGESGGNASGRETTKRGGKRGGKGRGKRGKDEEIKRSASPPRAPRGLRIAGSAALAAGESGQAAPPRELFPAHDFHHPPRGPRAERDRMNHRDQKPHGRPKLMAGNKDAFSRLTRGALGIPPDLSAAAGQDIRRSARNSDGVRGGP